MFKKCLDTQQGTGVQESRRLILNGHFFKGDAFKDSTLQESFTLWVNKTIWPLISYLRFGLLITSSKSNLHTSLGHLKVFLRTCLIVNWRENVFYFLDKPALPPTAAAATLARRPGGSLCERVLFVYSLSVCVWSHSFWVPQSPVCKFVSPHGWLPPVSKHKAQRG